MPTPPRPLWTRLRFPVLLFAFFWITGVFFWRLTGHLFLLFNFGYIGAALGLGIGIFTWLPRSQKPIGRRVAQFLIGLYLVAGIGLLGRENLQIEGLFFALFTGVIAGAGIHYMVAKIVGPMLFGRAFCGWACWTAMLLDLLPFRRSPGWIDTRWRHLRIVHLAFVALFVTLAFFGFSYGRSRPGNTVLGMLLGSTIYWIAGVALAFLFRDNRAFCKYVCPVPPLISLPAAFALLKITGDPAKCNDCGACARVCPMNIDIPAYLHRRQRNLSPECILCQTCVSICPKDALSVTSALDVGGQNHLKIR